MKHHFADFLDREGGYWSFTPNRDRYKLILSETDKSFDNINVITITKHDENWKDIYELNKLDELTLHEPSKEQFNNLQLLSNLKRLRVTHFRPKNIAPIGLLNNLEELVLEYVSGFSDLAPLRTLKKLKSIHFENLRRVSNFEGLSGMSSLKFLSIYGTFDWKQPIEDFEFINGLKNLEVYSSLQTITKQEYPALLPFCNLKKIKKIKIASNEFQTSEYALLSIGQPHASRTNWNPINVYAEKYLDMPDDDPRKNLSEEEIRKNHPEVLFDYSGKRKITDPNSEWFEFLGKRAGSIKCDSKNAKAKCEEFLKKYHSLQAKAKEILK